MSTNDPQIAGTTDPSRRIEYALSYMKILTDHLPDGWEGDLDRKRYGRICDLLTGKKTYQDLGQEAWDENKRHFDHAQARWYRRWLCRKLDCQICSHAEDYRDSISPTP